MLVLSKRKRPLLTEAEKAARKQRKLGIKCRRQSLVALSHQVVTLWQFGMQTPTFNFGPKNSKKIVEFLQATQQQYTERAAAKSFFYRALKRYREGTQHPHLEPHRDKRSESKSVPKRKNAAIITLVDELLSGEKATAPKVRAGLRRNGFQVSLSTIYRIARDLTYKWTKP